MPKSPLSVGVVQIHRAGVLRYTAIPQGSYRDFVSAINGSRATAIRFRPPREILFVAGETQLLTEIGRALSRKSRRVPGDVLVFELLDRDADVDLYDDVCSSLVVALTSKKVLRPWCVALVVANPQLLLESVFLQKKLCPLCEHRKIGLVVLSDRPDHSPTLLCQSSPPMSAPLPGLEARYEERAEESVTPDGLSADEIRAMTGVLFGHFVLRSGEQTYHLPALASIRKLAQNAAFVRQLHGDIMARLRDPRYAVLPLGIPLGGVRELAVGLAAGASDRLLVPAAAGVQHDTQSVVILCDMVGPMYALESTVRDLMNGGFRDILIAGVARFRNAPRPGVAGAHSYFELPFDVAAMPEGECRYCNQGVPQLEAEDFDGFARGIGPFDPLTFWQFVGQDERFYSVGHWASDRTPNHYLFRVLTEPIFRTWGYDLALRIRNALRANGVIPGWVQRIVIPDDPEAGLLASALADALNLRREDIIAVPRDALRSVAGPGIGEEGLRALKSCGGERLQDSNALIVDQAAHHFKTLSALRAICDLYNTTILGFAVFLDRTDYAFSKGEYLHDCHYISLYSWPCSPRRAHECPCAG